MALGASVANAAIINFAAEADIGGERGLANNAVLGPTASIGVPVTLTGTGGNPYLDASTGPGQFGGLGVCTGVAPGAQCVPSSGDNISVGEAVKVAFGAAFNIVQLSFRGTINGVEHLDLDANTQTLLIKFNGGGAVAYTFANAVAAAIGGAFSSANTIEFIYGGKDAAEFYVELISDVPLPGALPLLLSGLAGLGFASRRKRKAA